MAKPRVLVNSLSMTQGGGRSYLANLLRELARDDRGFDFTFLATPGQLDGLDTSGVSVRTLALPSWPLRVGWRVAFEELALPWLARRFDLLFCVADLSPPFGRTPTVVLLRNLNIYDRRWYDDARTRMLERLARWGLPRARRVLFPSQAALERIAELAPVPRERAAVVPYGISPELFAAPSGAPPARRYLFLPAAVERHKNVDVLVEALAHVKDAELEAWIAGRSVVDPGYQTELEAKARRLGVGDRVRFLGAVPYADVLAYHRGAVALVFPSFIETFGHPLLEAMLAETPIVASDIPTFREVAGEVARYFPAEDAEALARRVDAVQGEPEETRRRVAAGRARAAQFTWARAVDRLCEELSRALEAD